MDEDQPDARGGRFLWTATFRPHWFRALGAQNLRGAYSIEATSWTAALRELDDLVRLRFFCDLADGGTGSPRAGRRFNS
jgi:hypothetical protein